jgi:predicted amidohydrolase
LVLGVVETSEEPGRAYNTLVAFGPDGGRLAFYRKIYLVDAQGFGESAFIKPGRPPILWCSCTGEYGSG